MSGHDPELDAFGFIGLQADAESIQRATAAIERMLREHWRRLGNRQDQARDEQTRRTRDYFREQSRIQEEAFKKDERRDVERLKRLKARQLAGYKEAADLRAKDLSDQKAADKQSEISSRHRNKVLQNLQEHHLKSQRALQREETWERNEEIKRRNKLELQSNKARDATLAERQRQKNRIEIEQERRVTKQMEAELKEREAKQAAHHSRSINRSKAFWSITRGLVETSTRFMSSSIQAHYQRRHERQVSAEARELSSATGHETSKQGLLRRSFSSQERIYRSGYADQERISARSMAKQQGAIAAFQATSQKGLIGSFLRTRTLLLGGGAFLSARAIFGPVADYQQTQIAFEALLGSEAKAEKVLGRLRKFAEKTPFSFEGVAEGARRLLAVGFAARDITPALTDIGNVAATLGVGEEEINGVIRALGQMKGKGKASAEELQQISEQLPGFSAVEAIAKSLGITTQEAFEQMRAGAISGEEGVQAILQGMHEFPGAAGAMARQSETLNGRISTLKDTIQNLLIDTLLPLVDILADLTGVFTELITSLFRGSGVWAVVRSGLLGIAVAMGAVLAVKGAVTVFQLLGTALGILAANPLIVGLAAVAAIISILIREVPVVGDSFQRAFELISDAVQELWDLLSQGDFAGFWEELTNLDFSPVVNAFAPLADILVEAWDNAFKAVTQFIETAFEEVVQFFETGGVRRTADAVRDWLSDAFASVSELAEQLREQLEPVVTVITDFVVETFENLQEWLDSGGVERLAGIIGDAIETAFKAALDFLSTIDWGPWIEPALIAIGLAIAFIVGGWPALIVGALIAASPRLQEGLREFFDGIDWAEVGMTVLEGLRRIGEFIGGPVMETIFSKPVLIAVAAIAGAIIAGLGALLLGLIQGLAQSIPQIARNLRDLLMDALDAGVRALANTPLGGIASIFRDTFGEIFEAVIAGLDFLGALIDAITGKGDWSTVAETAWNLIVQGFQAIFSWKTMFERMLPEILDGLGVVFDAISDWISDVTGEVEGPLGGLLKVFTAPFEFMIGIVGDLLDRVGDVISGFIDIVAGIFTGDWRRVVEGFGEIFGGIVGFFRDVFTRLWNVIRDTLTGLGQFIWGVIRDGFHFVTSHIRGWNDGLLDFFDKLPERIVRRLAGIGHTIWEHLQVAFDFVLDHIEDVIDSILEFFGDLPGQIADLLRAAVDRVLPGGERGEDPSRPGGGGGDRGVDPSGGINAGSGTPRGFFGTAPAGGAPTAMPFDLVALTEWQETVLTLTSNIRSAFETMNQDVVETVDDMGDRIQRSLEQSMRNLESIGRKGADRTANAISSELRAGVREVTRIVAGYATALAASLNPLLEGIGAAKISAAAPGANILTFAQGGIPNIARPGDGPIVHVYNEGSSGRGSSHGEAYIPFDPTYRSRAKSIADRTVGRLGGRVQWFADGGYTGGLPNLTGDVIGLVPEFARRLSMFGTRVGSAFHVNSGFRSYDEQVRLYQAYLAGTGNLAAPPGSSLHEFGLAADGPHWGGKSPNLNGLHYPVTGEPWHTEPIEGRGLADGAFAGIVPLAKPPDAGQRGQLSRVAAAMMQYVYDKALDYASSISFSPDTSIAGGSPASRAQASAWILEAMGIVGAPSNWLAPLLARAWQESGFDPRAINLWDSNAAAGNPSKGLFQTIATTFAAYALPGHGNIWNPVDNAIAAIRYIIARYGSPFNLPSGGYRNGGVIDQPTWALMGEGGHKEVVLPLENRSRLRSLLTETGLWADILAAASGPSVSPIDIPSSPSQSSRSGRRIDLNLTIDTGAATIDPVLYSELAGAVRSGVADGMSRAEAIQERW